ncbi:MAG: SDR family NAD(P)-dependent oxidoreductase [Egibacteraceae bacterium]
MSDAMVWISGGSAGLGAALVATVPFDDPHVVDISRSGGTDGTEHLPADLADPASWVAVAQHFHARLAAFAGDRAVFVHNAGTLEPMGFAGEVDTEEYRRNVLLNSAAPQVLGHAFLAAVRDSGFGGRADLMLLSSGAARNAVAGWSSYGAAKAAADHWVRAVGLEQQRRGGSVRVLAVAPGVMATAMQEQIRAMDARDFPDVERFRRLHAEGALRDPLAAARDVWAVVTDDSVTTGAVVDVRDRR